MHYRSLAARFAPAVVLCLLVSTTAAQQPKDITQVLMITDERVIGSKTSAPKRASWTFGNLMQQMSGGTPVGAFIVNWLRQLETDQVVNGFTVKGRSSVRSKLIDVWKARDGFAGKPDTDWQTGLKLENAPFQLSAIIYRPDLLIGNISGQGTHWAQSGGEGRFIFQAIDASKEPLPMTVIFEYDLPATIPDQVLDWARQWKALANQDIGSDAYANDLEAITRKFSDADPNLERPNNVPLNQLRTNEFLGGPSAGPWELREFKLFAGELRMDTVKRNPDLSFDNKQELADYVTSIANQDSLLVVPAKLNGKPFLAGSSRTPFGFKWTLPGVSEPVRKFKFGINTCNGCHAGETDTLFLHVDLGSTTQRLSNFLVGTKEVTCDDVSADAVKPDHDPQIGDLRKRQCLMLALTELSVADAEQILLNLPLERPSTSVLALRPGGFDVRQFLLSRRDRVE